MKDTKRCLERICWGQSGVSLDLGTSPVNKTDVTTKLQSNNLILSDFKGIAMKMGVMMTYNQIHLQTTPDHTFDRMLEEW